MNADTEIVEQREAADGIVTDRDGNVIYNSFQADDPIILTIYANGERELFRKSTGQSIFGRFRPEEFRSISCPHCGHKF